jgi:hypothetical protein
LRRHLLLLALAAIAVVLAFRPLQPMSILPGFEGLKAGVEGFQPKSDRTYRIDEPLPWPYEWSSSDPRQASVLRHETVPVLGDDKGHIKLRVSEPEKFVEAFTVPQRVEYWVQEPGGNWVHVVGEIKIYRIYVSLETLRDSERYVFSGEKFWIALTSVTWDKAMADPTNPGKWGRAWEAPLAVFVVSAEIDDAGSPHKHITPGRGGNSVTLYADPQQTGTIGDLGVLAGTVNTTLSSGSHPWSPDSRLRRTAYFAITLDDWGADIGLFRSYERFPAANLVLKVYTIVLGKFIYTNPELVDWERSRGETGGWLQGVFDAWGSFIQFLQNPFAFTGAAVFLLLLVGFAVFVGVVALRLRF